MRVNCENGERLAKRVVWLAWQASRCLGMGVLQNRPDANEEEVWINAYNRGDYPGGRGLSGCKEGEAHADYVFGRMMKLFVRFGADWVELGDSTPRADYQSWSGKYPTYEALVKAAQAGLSE